MITTTTLRERIEKLANEMEECSESSLDLTSEEWAARLRSALAQEPQGDGEPIQWLGCADTVDLLNERYEPGSTEVRPSAGMRFVALGGPTTLYDRGPERNTEQGIRVPMGWWVCDVGGVPAITPYRPLGAAGSGPLTAVVKAARVICADHNDGTDEAKCFCDLCVAVRDLASPRPSSPPSPETTKETP